MLSAIKHSLRSYLKSFGVLKADSDNSVFAQIAKAGRFSRPLVTRVAPFTAFYPAEKYHQDYLVAHPTSPYIVINDLPKLAEFKRLMPSVDANQPVLVGSK
jgi:peptide-methionine (S)-S-oxide reductase